MSAVVKQPETEDRGGCNKAGDTGRGGEGVERGQRREAFDKSSLTDITCSGSLICWFYLRKLLHLDLTSGNIHLVQVFTSQSDHILGFSSVGVGGAEVRT